MLSLVAVLEQAAWRSLQQQAMASWAVMTGTSSSCSGCCSKPQQVLSGQHSMHPLTCSASWHVACGQGSCLKCHCMQPGCMPELLQEMLLNENHKLEALACPALSLHSSGPYFHIRKAPRRVSACRSASVTDMQRLRAAVEGTKQELSVREETTLSVPDFARGSGLDVLVTRAAFEEAATPLLSRLWPPLQELGRQACVSWASRCVSP